MEEMGKKIMVLDREVKYISERFKEKLMTIKRGILKSFNSVSYTATVQVSGSAKAYLEGVAVARNLPAVEMITGRQVAIAFFSPHIPGDSVVFAVYS